MSIFFFAIQKIQIQMQIVAGSEKISGDMRVPSFSAAVSLYKVL